MEQSDLNDLQYSTRTVAMQLLGAQWSGRPSDSDSDSDSEEQLDISTAIYVLYNVGVRPTRVASEE